MTKVICLFAFLVSSSAFAAHIFSAVLPLNHAPVTNVRITSVEYGRVAVEWHFDPNCPMDMSCPSIATYETKVRVSVEYDSPAGAYEESREVMPSATGWVTRNLDFDPAEFSAEELAALTRAKGNAKDLLIMRAGARRSTVSVVDQDLSDDCRTYGGDESNEFYRPNCTPHVVYKNKDVIFPVLTFRLK